MAYCDFNLLGDEPIKESSNLNTCLLHILTQNCVFFDFLNLPVTRCIRGDFGGGALSGGGGGSVLESTLCVQHASAAYV